VGSLWGCRHSRTHKRAPKASPRSRRSRSKKKLKELRDPRSRIALTCGATAVVAGLAYLLTAFDREARDGPGEAIGRVCGGPYTTTPEDLKGG